MYRSCSKKIFGFSKKKERENTGCQLSIDGGGVKAPERDHGIGFTTFRIESKEIFFEIVQETRSTLCSKIKRSVSILHIKHMYCFISL